MTTANTKGSFQRSDAGWRFAVSSDPDAKFPAEPDRYHLYVAHACPWAHRTLLVRALKGLQLVISVTFVHPVWQKTKPNDPNDDHAGWVFSRAKGSEPFTNSFGIGGPFPANVPGCDPDPILGAQTLREVYEAAGDTSTLFSVPLLWDKKQRTIVSNESADIIRMFNAEFNKYAKHPTLDLYPIDLRPDIDEANTWIYPTINNGVYRCGFAKTQDAYDRAISELTESFDRVNEILQKQKFIAGDIFTEADVRLFVTLLRFDEVYHTYFKTNTRNVTTSPAILNYCRTIYHMKGVVETIDMEKIKLHYYTSHPTYNHYSIIPRGADFIKLLEENKQTDE